MRLEAKAALVAVVALRGLLLVASSKPEDKPNRCQADCREEDYQKCVHEMFTVHVSFFV